MKRNPLPGFVVAPVCLPLSLIACLLAVVVVANRSAMAQGNRSNDATEGSLQTVDSNGQPTGACPLKHTNVKTEISGFLARTVVTQQFDNPFPDKIEAVYTFPLPPAAAVDDMTIVVGNRTVKGQIMRREDAQAKYDAARSSGQVAALLHQQRPNVFVQAVANILPGQNINVTISYVETLKYDEGAYEWSFPMVVAPRYTPAPESPRDAIATNKTAAETGNNEAAEGETAVSDSSQSAAEAAPVAAPAMPAGMRAGHDVSIEVTIDAGVPLVSFKSQTHEIEALQSGSEKATVRLRDQAAIPNKDFVLRYAVAGSRIEDAFLSHRHGKDGFFTFILQPPQHVVAADTVPSWFLCWTLPVRWKASRSTKPARR